MFEVKIKNTIYKVVLGVVLCFAGSLQATAAQASELISSGYISQLAKIQRKTLPFKDADVGRIRDKALENALSRNDIETVLEARRCWAKLLSRQGRFISMEALAEDPAFKGVDNVRQLAAVQCMQCDESLHDFLYRVHQEKRRGIAPDKRKAIVQGAGPCGLLAGIKLFLEGMDVSVLEKRNGTYTRRQIVSLDPAWVAELRLILGSELERLIDLGRAELLPDQSLQIAICDLEKALKKCLLDLAAFLESRSLAKTIALHYNTELTEVLPPEKGRRFMALAKSRLDDSLEKHPFDLIVFAGGANDPLRDKYLARAEPRTLPKDYTVAIWRKLKDPVSRAGKEYAKGLYMQPFEKVLDKAYDKLAADIRTISGIREDKRHRLLALLSQVHWEGRTPFREFENRYQLYIGVEMPPTLTYLRTRLMGWIEAASDSAEQSATKLILRKLDLTTLRLIAEIWEINDEEFAIDEKNCSTFTLVQKAAGRPVRMVQQEGIRAVFTAVGDDLVSPHFFSGSGLTSGRDSVRNLAKAVHRLNKEEDKDWALARLAWNQGRVISFTVLKGQRYVKALGGR